MEKEIDKTYNELTIKKIIQRPDGENRYRSWGNTWAKCECSCGEIVEAPLYGIKHDFIKSCGHLRKDKAIALLDKIHKEHPAPNAKYLTYKGVRMNISEWSKKTGIPRTTIMNRLDNDWPIDKVLEKTERIAKKH